MRAKTARFRQRHRRSLSPVSRHRRLRRRNEVGFTLIELLTVIAILPIVLGGITVALITVISQQNTVASKVSNSGDVTSVSAVFVRDVQSSQFVTISANPSSALFPWQTCVTSSPVVSFEWPGTSPVVVSYAVVTQSGSHKESLFRYVCQGLNPPISSLVAHSVQGLTPTITGVSCYGNNNCPPAASQWGVGWTSTQGVGGVTLGVTAPQVTASGTDTYKYSLTGVPRISSNLSRGTNKGGHPPLLMLGTGSPDVSCGGHNTVQVNGTASINSASSPAIQTNGNAGVSATSIFTNTPGSFNGNNISPPAATGTGVQAPDPYDGLIPPATGLPIANTYADGSTYPGTYAPLIVRTSGGYEGPGLYTNGFSVNSAQQLASGIYVIEGGLSLTGNGAISTASGGVLIYIFSGSATISGNGGLDLEPLSSPPTGLPSGLTIWMDASDTGSMTITGSNHGGGLTNIGGTVYAPNVQLSTGGNGSVNVGSLVANSLSCQGGGNSGGITIG